ncbi:MAG: fibronectin, type III domain-containing protein, partial [Parcubacteria group bacterium Gr01-1014_38]
MHNAVKGRARFPFRSLLTRSWHPPRGVAVVLALGIGVLLLAGASVRGQATTLHVSPTGSDANACTAAAPCRQIRRALALAQPGTTISVADGSYLGFDVSNQNGTPTAPIVIRAAGQNAVVTPTTDRADNRDTISITSSSYLVIDGLRSSNANRAGIRVSLSSNITVRNGVFGNNGMWGIFTDFTAPGLVLENNKTFGSVGQHGIYVSNSQVVNDNPVIRGNESFGNTQNGIQVNGDCFSGGDGTISGALIEGNIVHDNNLKGFSLISMSDSVVRNNLIYNNGIVGGAGGVHLADEPGCGKPSNNNVVVNNTVVEPRIAGVRMSLGAQGNVLFNNLIVSAQGIADETGLNTVDATSNVLRTSTTGLFVNPAAGDYHLLPSSPPQGPAYDVGADELGTTITDTTPPVISTVAAGSMTNTTATITWTTNEPSDSQVEYGTTITYGSSTTLNPALVTSHSQVVSGLTANTFYHYRVKSRDAAGNLGVSADFTFTTTNVTLSLAPRVMLTPARLAQLRTYMQRNTTRWQALRAQADAATGTSGTDMLPVLGLAYQVTGNVTYAQRAASILRTNAVASNTIFNLEHNGYYYRTELWYMAVGFDWVKDQLTPAERAQVAGWLMDRADAVWPETTPSRATGWAVSDPANNYFWGFMMSWPAALAADGFDTGSHPISGTNRPQYHRNLALSKWRTLVRPFTDGWGKGGVWAEGTNYDSTYNMALILDAHKTATGQDLINEPGFNFLKDSLKWRMYSTAPNNGVAYNYGDQSRYPGAPLWSLDRLRALPVFADITDQTLRQQTKYWLEQVAPATLDQYHKAWEFLYYDEDLPVTPLSSLPLSYYAEGPGLLVK